MYNNCTATMFIEQVVQRSMRSSVAAGRRRHACSWVKRFGHLEGTQLGTMMIERSSARIIGTSLARVWSTIGTPQRLGNDLPTGSAAPRRVADSAVSRRWRGCTVPVGGRRIDGAGVERECGSTIAELEWCESVWAAGRPGGEGTRAARGAALARRLRVATRPGRRGRPSAPRTQRPPQPLSSCCGAHPGRCRPVATPEARQG